MAKRRDLIRMSDEEVDALLHERQSMSVATLGPDGGIHMVAMWYGFIDGAPAFETYAKSQKILNLRRDPRITVLVETGDQYDSLRGVELVGKGVILEDEASVMTVARSVVERYFPVANDADLDAVAAGLANKRVAVKVEVEKIVSWDHSKLGGGY
jgi:PPOX class probable F420-dependent enzyme